MITEIDFIVLDFIREHMTSPFGDAIMPFITRLGDGGLLWIAAAVLLMIPARTRKIGAALAVSLIINLIFCNILIKPAAARIRPFNVNTAAELLIPPPHGFSFPSGHTSASFTSASVLFFERNRLKFLWIPAAVIALLIGFSRLYLYVHYPSDVIAGAVLGILFGAAGTALTDVTAKKFIKKQRVM